MKYLKTQPKSLVVADFGCGDAELAQKVKQKVYLFDLESDAPGVIACSMANVPLPDDSVHVAVFSLSLMGTDYGKFLEEAHRVSDNCARLFPFFFSHSARGVFSLRASVCLQVAGAYLFKHAR